MILAGLWSLQGIMPKCAIDTRLHEMQLDHGGTPEERQAITNALSGLNVLRGEFERRSHDAGSSNA